MLKHRNIHICALALALSAFANNATARNAPPPPFDTSGTIQFEGPTDSLPTVRFVRGSESFLRALNPDLYPTDNDLRRESRWVRRHAKDLERFWELYGDSALYSMSKYAGIPWQTASIEIQLVRYLGAWESSWPLTLPLGGKRVGAIIEAAPTGAGQIVSLLHLLAHKLVSDAPRLDFPQLNHPLLKRTPYHRENICELIALSVASDILNHDALLEMMNSPEYARRHKGYDLLFSDLWGIWTLSETLPLTDYLAQEPFSGSVRYHADSAYSAQEIRRDIEQVVMQRDLPIEGQMGVALEPMASGFRVQSADPERLGFAYGIIEGDVIRTINGLRPRTLREFYREFINTYEAEGANLKIRRDGKEYSVLIKLALNPFDAKP